MRDLTSEEVGVCGTIFKFPRDHRIRQGTQCEMKNWKYIFCKWPRNTWARLPDVLQRNVEFWNVKCGCLKHGWRHKYLCSRPGMRSTHWSVTENSPTVLPNSHSYVRNKISKNFCSMKMKKIVPGDRLPGSRFLYFDSLRGSSHHTHPHILRVCRPSPTHSHD